MTLDVAVILFAPERKASSEVGEGGPQPGYSKDGLSCHLIIYTGPQASPQTYGLRI